MASNLNNPQVFFEINIGKKNIGRVVFELFADTTPRTAENFRALCTGERGISPICGKKLHFRECIFHRIISGFMAQGGDFTNHNGTGGESIYGPKFHDENFIRKHDSPGLLSMANSGSNTNGSQFFLTFRNTPHLDGRHVVFGKIISGMDVLKVIEMVATDSNDCPRAPVTIIDCGQIGLSTDQEENTYSSNSYPLQNDVNTRKNKYLIPSADQNEVDEEPSSANEVIAVAAAAAATPQQDEEEEVVNDDDVEEKTAGMTETQKRLFKIRLKLNQSRKLNKKEVEQEYKRLADPKYEQKQRAADWAERKKKCSSEVKAVGLTESDAYMLDTAEKAEKLQEKTALKDRNRSSFGWEAFTAEATHRAYEKRLSKLPGAPGVQSTTLEENPLDYGKIGSQVLPSHLDRMSKELEDREKARDAYSRRRMSYDSSNVDFINDTNAHFNKKIKRAFDKYTVEIRQNLERGTAI